MKAQAFEIEHWMEYEAVRWQERRIIVYSPAYATSQRTAFEHTLSNTKQELEKLFVPKQARKKIIEVMPCIC